MSTICEKLLALREHSYTEVTESVLKLHKKHNVKVNDDANKAICTMYSLSSNPTYFVDSRLPSKGTLTYNPKAMQNNNIFLCFQIENGKDIIPVQFFQSSEQVDNKTPAGGVKEQITLIPRK